MSFKIAAPARTVNVFNLETKQIPDGKGGTYEVNSIMFVVASNRNHKETVYDATGKPVLDAAGNKIKERKSDFILVKATGETAKTINAYLNKTRLENGVQKHISRLLFIEGSLETYDKTEEITVKKLVNMAGQNYNVEFVEQFKHSKAIIMLDTFEFLDSKPAEDTVVVAPSTPAMTITVAPAVAPVAPVAAPTFAPQTVPAVVQAPVGFVSALPMVAECPAEFLNENMPYTKINENEGIVSVSGMTYKVRLKADGRIETCPF